LSQFLGYIEDKIAKCEMRGEFKAEVSMKKGAANFNRLAIRKRTGELLDFEAVWEFVATVPLVPTRKVVEVPRDLFLNLKSLDCVLKWTGSLLLFARPSFKMSPFLQPLTKLVPDIRPSPRLAETLNSNKDLMVLLAKIKPDEIHNFVNFPFKEVSSEEEFRERLIDYCRSPKDVTYVISLVKTVALPIRPNSMRNLFMSIFEILDKISIEVRKIANT